MKLKQCEKAEAEALKAVDTQKEEVAKAEQAVQDAIKELETAEQELEKAKQELETAKQELEKAKADLEKAEAAVVEAQKAVDDAQKQVDEAQKELDKINEELNNLNEQIAAKQEEKANLAEQKGKLDASLQAVDEQAEAYRQMAKAMEPAIAAMEAELEAAWEELNSLKGEELDEQAQAEIDKANAEAQAAREAAKAAQKAAQEALAESATSKLRLGLQQIAMQRVNAIIEKLKALYNYDGTSNYTINKDEYDALNKKMRKGEALNNLEKLQMAVYELLEDTKKMIEEAVEKFKPNAGVDKNKLVQVKDTVGREMFKDADGKIVYKSVDEEGKTVYTYEDGKPYEGEEKDLKAIMGVPVVEDKGEVYTDAEGKKVYKNTDEEGNDVYTYENGEEYQGNVEDLKQKLTEYIGEDDIIAEINAKFDEMDAKIAEAEAARAEAPEPKAIDTEKRDAEAEKLGLTPTGREGAYTKESPLGTTLYVWDPESETFKDFPAGEADDPDCDFTPDGKIIDKENEEALKADANIAIQEQGLNVIPGEPFKAEKDGITYEYNKETGKFEAKADNEKEA